MAKGDILLAMGMQFWGTHGYYPEENVFGQKFIIDVRCSYDMEKMGKTDDLEAGLSYVTVYETTKKIVTGTQYKLLQALAEHIAREINQAWDLEWVEVTVKKPFVAIGGVLDYTGVCIRR